MSEQATAVRVNVVEAGTGKAVVGAEVDRLWPVKWVGSNQPWIQLTEPELVGVTDAKGQIKLNCQVSQRNAFLVRAAGKIPRPFGFWGCVPAAHQVALRRQTASLSGQILDSTGKPIADAPVRAEMSDWRLLEMVRLSLEHPQLDYPVVGQTNSHGQFKLPAGMAGRINGVIVHRKGQWHWVAPDQTISGREMRRLETELREGCFVGQLSDNARPMVLVPATQPVVEPTLAIHLRVVDATTNKVIQKVRITPGGSAAPTGSFVHPLPGNALDLNGGEINWSFYDQAWAYFLRVEAKGYATTPTRIVKASEKQANIVLKLQRAKSIAVKVLTPDGKPAAAAQAFIATPTIKLTVPMGEPYSGAAAPFAVADAHGILKFSPPGEMYRLAIVQKAGSAEVSCEDMGKKPIKLTAWAGARLRVGTTEHPAAGAPVQSQTYISEELNCPISWSGYYHLNSAGEVKIARWPSGRILLSISEPESSLGWSHMRKQWQLNPDEEVAITLLASKTTVRAALGEVPGYKWSVPFITRIGPPVDISAKIRQLSGRQQTAAIYQIFDDAPDQVDQQNLFDSVSDLGINPDGTLAVGGIDPGTYRLAAIASAINQDAQVGAKPQIDWYFSVLDSEPAVVDLGVLHPNNTPALGVGQIVPDLTAKTMYGNPFSLKSCRGHWVLLDFWGTWCGFCIAEEPGLKDAYQQWAKPGKLMMVSVSVGDTVKAVREHVKKNHLDWTQLVLGQGKTDVPQHFGVQGFPDMMLISPEGKVVETDLRGAGLRNALMKYLGP